MQPLAIVEDLDVLEDRRPRLFAGVEGVMMDELVLERAEEALGARIVEAVALAGHAGDHAMGLEHALIASVGILGGFKRSSQQPHREVCDDYTEVVFGADRTSQVTL